MADLNLSNFTNVFDDDFTKDTSLNTGIWSSHWGNPDQYWFSGANGLLIAGTHAAGWTPVGIEQNPSGKSAGEGYGLFQFTGKAAVAGQGVGICFVMWRADNVWLDKTNPGLLTELDILESWDKTQTGQATDHYYNTVSNANGQVFHTVNTDLTQFHTYAMDWEAGSLTYYVDGKELYQITGATVPKDYAHGGVNYTMGAEVVNEASYETTPTVGLYIKDMSYSTSNNGVTSPAPPVVPVSPVVPPVVVAATITLSAPGTIQETGVGAGVTVVEKIATTGIKTLYAEVLTKAGVVETAYQAVTLDAGGNGVFTTLLAQSGDTIKTVDSLTAPTVTSTSAAVTITDPVVAPPIPAAPVISVVQPASLTVGQDVFTGSVTGSPASVELAWHTNGVETDGAADFVKATVSADGSFSVTLDIDHAGVASSLWTEVDGIVGKAFTATPTAVTVPPVIVPPVIVPPVIIPVSPSSMFLISSVTEDNGRLLLAGDKEVGKAATMREFMDGKYLGVMRDGMADGSFSMHLADVTSGAHVLKLTLDGSSATAVYDFTKLAGGSIVQTASAAAAASHAIVTSVTHDLPAPAA